MNPYLVEYFKKARQNQKVEPLTKEEVSQQLNKYKAMDDELDTLRAYRLIKEQEKHKNDTEAVWSSLLRISYNK